MHASQLLFSLVVKGPIEKKKKKKRKRERKRREQHKVIGTGTQSFYNSTCIARDLLSSFTFRFFLTKN